MVKEMEKGKNIMIIDKAGLYFFGYFFGISSAGFRVGSLYQPGNISVPAAISSKAVQGRFICVRMAVARRGCAFSAGNIYHGTAACITGYAQLAQPLATRARGA